MIIKAPIFFFLLLGLFSISVYSQGGAKPRPAAANAADSVQIIRGTPAYAEVLFRKTELESDLESLLVDYTEDYPKIKEIKLELGLIKTEMDRLLAVKAADASKLTLALGKLIVRKITLQTELEALLLQYKDEHPDVKRARRKVAIFEGAIKEILG
jgi:hypothetical protein